MINQSGVLFEDAAPPTDILGPSDKLKYLKNEFKLGVALMIPSVIEAS